MKVGDYVRTEISSLNLQSIGKIEKIISEDFIHTDIGTYDKENIIKSSLDIIDLIEAGDYVNGHKIVDIAEAPKRAVYIEDVKQKSGLIPYTRDNITSILTKEQFESMEYKIC